MADEEDFFYVSKDKEQAVDIFINLATIAKMQWDGRR